MKIFANNFAVFLTIDPGHGHFRFEGRSQAEIEDWLAGENQLFPGQVRVHYAAKENLQAASAWLGKLLRDEKIGRSFAQLTVVVEEEASREALLADLAIQFKPITAAGGLVLDNEPALLTILRDGRWDLPKGKVEKDEDIPEAAWREVAEETGLENHVLGEKSCETYHVFPDRSGRWRLKTTHWYAMHSPKRMDLQPQQEEGITEVRWMPIAELKKGIPVTYPQIMELMRSATSDLLLS